jgi:hypothetical protein
MSSLVLIKNNRQAFFLNHWIIFTGFALSILCTLGLHAGWISPFYWMVGVGTGVYMAYIPFNSLLFDRLIATLQSGGNVGFLMYLVDSFGYLGSSLILVASQFGGFGDISWLHFYSQAVILFLSISMVLIAGSFLYFQTKLKRKTKPHSPSLTLLNSL